MERDGRAARGRKEQGQRRGVDGEGAHCDKGELEAEGGSERGSLSEESVDSEGRAGEEEEKRSYWKEVEQKVEIGVSERLKDACVARRAAYEAQFGGVRGGAGSGTEEGEPQSKGGHGGGETRAAGGAS
eukprot:6206948-Pleurochrysis_carterae.AAC.4